MKKNPQILKFALSATLLAANSTTQSQTKPNVIVILVDDAGFADFSCFGGLIPTPNIDKLAQNGVRMSQMYNCARSCPSRASLLTGLYPQQTGVGNMTNFKYKDAKGYQGYLNNNCVTIAEVLKQNGYSTYISGKWHVGHEHGVTPAKRGFEHGIHSPAGGFYTPTQTKADDQKKSELYIDDKLVTDEDERLPKNWYTTDLYTQFSKQYIDEATKAQKPFFLYLAYNAPHFPLTAPEEDIDKFKGEFCVGWDKMRIDIYNRQMKMNIFGKKYPLTKRNPLIPLWIDVDSRQQLRCEKTMEVYAAMIYHLDRSIGELVEKLKANHQLENTIIMFMSDNGASAEGSTVYGAEEYKKGEIKPGWLLGQCWAEMSNTPFFLYKVNVHEGGISTPFIVSYPNGIPKSQNGKIVHQAGHIVDVMASIVSLTGSKYPENYNGNAIIPMQGINLLPMWKGNKIERKSPLIWEHGGGLALRDGKWKIVKERNETEWELYNMDDDRTETNNLASANKEILSKMKVKFDEMAKEVGIISLPFGQNPRWYVPVTKY